MSFRPPNAKSPARTTLRLTGSSFDALRELSRATRVPLTALLERAVEFWLQHQTDYSVPGRRGHGDRRP
jgi:hypothetical protein